MPSDRPLVLLLQLPIPPPGFGPVRGNVPLAAGYLKLFARRRGLESRLRIEVFAPDLANTLGDQGLVEAILWREPWLVGLTCYLWNVDRTLWLAEQLKRRRPDLRIVLGGPEITADNRWVLDHPAVDHAVFGEGEQTMADLLGQLLNTRADLSAVPGLWSKAVGRVPAPRAPLARLDEVSSPYLDGILEAGPGESLLLETTRGCRFRCKFCYYPKSYDRQYFLSEQQVRANLDYAASHGVEEVFLLDPTLNQRPDFVSFLRLLRDGNPEGQFTYSAELRAEGIDAATAQLLSEAHFTEIEVGLQSVDREAQRQIDRRVPLGSFQRGVRAMLDAGLQVKVDLIVGLPGDTPDSVRRGFDFLESLGPASLRQVFYLSILPGTALRAEAESLGLRCQTRPPYYVLGTPTLSLPEIAGLVDEAQQRFGIEFDPLPEPVLEPVPLRASVPGDLVQSVCVDLDRTPWSLPEPARRGQTFSLRLRSADFGRQRSKAAALVAQLLADNPHTTLQVVLEPVFDTEGESPSPRGDEVGRADHLDHLDRLDRQLNAAVEAIQASCFSSTSYLDRYYSLGTRPAGAKRIVLLLPASLRPRWGTARIAAAAQFGSILWTGAAGPLPDLQTHEYLG